MSNFSDRPATRRGDVWILGRHRLMCGDCTEAEDVRLLLGDAVPDLMLTDPPYCAGGLGEAGKWEGSVGTSRKDGVGGKAGARIVGDAQSSRGYMRMLSRALSLSPCLCAYIFSDWRMLVYLWDVCESWGAGVRSLLVWDKLSPGMGCGWRTQYELILLACKASPRFDKRIAHGAILQHKRSGNKLHPTQKPVELLRDILRVSVWAEGVYDPFGGSGSVMMACEAQGLPCWTMEREGAFVDVAVGRFAGESTEPASVRLVRDGAVVWGAEL